MPSMKKHAVRYPWDKWLKKKKFTLVYGEDFQCDPYGMYQNVRQAARRADVKVIIRMEGSNIKVEVRHGEKPRKWTRRESHGDYGR